MAYKSALLLFLQPNFIFPVSQPDNNHTKRKIKMKHLKLLAMVFLALSIAACGTAPTATVETTPIPTVIADDTIIAEGRVEPAHYAEITFNTNGAVSKVLVKEGQSVKKGDLLISLGDESDTNYAAAQVELASAQQAWDNLINSRGADFAQATIDLKDAKEAKERAYQYLVYLQNDKRIPQTESRRVLTNGEHVTFQFHAWQGVQFYGDRLSLCDVDYVNLSKVCGQDHPIGSVGDCHCNFSGGDRFARFCVQVGYYAVKRSGNRESSHFRFRRHEPRFEQGQLICIWAVL